MQKNVSLAAAVLGWFAIIAQLVLMLNNRTAPVGETMVRFFSYFTILTNIMVALFFTGRFFNHRFTRRPGLLTAVTGYIFVVGIVYQVLLRHLWQPVGLQQLVDELLHSVTPVLTLVFWFLYEQKKAVQYRQIPGWLIYPALYIAFVLLRGGLSGFYPYPFINAAQLGLPKALLNGLFILLFFILVQVLLVGGGKKIPLPKNNPGR